MRLAHFGTFDVANYGDLLFPRLVEHHLRGSFDEFVHISPVGGRRIYTDVPVSSSLDDVNRQGVRFDAVMIGGGNIIHARKSDLPDYRHVQRHAYAKLWIGATQLAASQQIPLVVNAPGVPYSLRGPSAWFGKMMFEQAAYGVVRDEESARRLKDMGIFGVGVVPDTALLVREVFAQEGGAHQTFTRRALPERYAAVHLNERYLSGEGLCVAERLDSISRKIGMPLVLIPIGPCHGDDRLAASVAGRMQTQPMVLEPIQVAQIAATIAGAECYIGSSLHGFITAASFERPCLLVAEAEAQHKFQGLLTHLGAESRLFLSWQALESELEVGGPAVWNNLRNAPSIEAPTQALREHWVKVELALKSGRPALMSGRFRRISPERVAELDQTVGAMRRVGGRVRHLRRRPA